MTDAPLSGPHAYITRIASVLPNDPVDNETMEDVLGVVGSTRSRARRVVLRSNGIKSRHYVLDPITGVPRQSNAELTAKAIRALADDTFNPDTIDCLVCGTSIPDQIMPNHAVMVHGELGIPSCEVVATAGICLSGTTAMKYAWMSVVSGQAKRAVATGSEIASLMLRGQNYEPEHETKLAELEANPGIAFEKDFLRWMLSDGAGAVLIEGTPRSGQMGFRIDWMELFSAANEMPVCMYAGGDKDEAGKFQGWLTYDSAARERESVMAVKQDVRLLNDNIIEFALKRPLTKVIQKHGLKVEDIDWFLPHMSSEYFRKEVARGLTELGFEIPKDRWFTNLSERGNTGSASIYIMLDELINGGRVSKGDRILCIVPESGRFSSGIFHLTAV